MGMFAAAAAPCATIDALRAIFPDINRDTCFLARTEAGGGRVMSIAPRNQCWKSEIERAVTMISRYGVKAQ
jgi:hypothetical protein